jgi:hypothetical protein
MAEAGIGMADVLLLIGPSVSRGRRTENMPPSCDMLGAYIVLQVRGFQCVAAIGLVVTVQW